MVFSTPNETLLNQVIDLFKKKLPIGVEDIGDDIRLSLKTLLAESLNKMDLVTREEFDVQQHVLARTRSKLDALEKLMSELEQNQAQDSTLEPGQ